MNKVKLLNSTILRCNYAASRNPISTMSPASFRCSKWSMQWEFAVPSIFRWSAGSQITYFYDCHYETSKYNYRNRRRDPRIRGKQPD